MFVNIIIISVLAHAHLICFIYQFCMSPCEPFQSKLLVLSWILKNSVMVSPDVSSFFLSFSDALLTGIGILLLSLFSPSCCVLHCVVLVAQLCLTLCEPLHCSPPGPSVHGILQARILEWAAMPSSRGSPQPGSSTLQADSLPSQPPGERRSIVWPDFLFFISCQFFRWGCPLSSLFQQLYFYTKKLLGSSFS